MKILNIYGQEMPHTDAKIVGNWDGLWELYKSIGYALFHHHKATTGEKLFASDGEGYKIIVERHDDDWGMNAPKDSFWNQKESWPEYTALRDDQLARIVALINRIESEPMATGEPGETVQIARWQVTDELRETFDIHG